ncbi:ubiquitin hydrolase [Trypanosoma grayi]|uniref:ubiquitin hydrolase n=1 Tax=Trypanosoma grayi TaxID=71804 RepID=UPI0004F4467F|nr:ubiquitin hydrolase [Trypanosoma grayi]KEG15440.1 ubiquitin hydrolase [Trypanosoma grayi]
MGRKVWASGIASCEERLSNDATGVATRTRFGNQGMVLENIPYVGLVNQGSTCYLNSVIQVLFHLPSFRRMLYSVENPEPGSITLALRNIFAQLNCATSSVSTNELTEAFGWENNEEWIQHDVHEMLQKLLDSLETVCKNTPLENIVRDHFYGELTYITRTVDGVAHTLYRKEGFHDVELLVKNKNTIAESFSQWAEPERIEGVSLEFEKDGPSTIHTVERCQRFTRLPRVLLIHPNRVEFCMESFEVKTLHSKWTFPLTLDLEPYLLQDDKNTPDTFDFGTVYDLRSVVVHQGVAENGHYLAYVLLDEGWMYFNDAVVSRVPEEDVMRAAWGGEVIGSSHDSNERASLLLYVNRTVANELLTEEPVPENIKEVVRSIVTNRDRKWRGRWESVSFQYFTDVESLTNVLEDIPDADEGASTVTVHAASSLQEVHAAIATAIGQTPDRIRVWMYEGGSPSGVTCARLHTDVRSQGRLFVETLPASKDTLDPASFDEAFFVIVRSTCNNSLVSHGVLHGRGEIKALMETYKRPMKCFVCEYGLSVSEVQIDEILPGFSVIICPLEMSENHVVEMLRQRQFREVTVFLLDRCKAGKWTPIGSFRFDESTPYTKFQQETYRLLSAAHQPLPPSPEYIGFHCSMIRGEEGPSLAVCPLYNTNPEPVALSIIMQGSGGRGVLYCALLPAPLCTLDTVRLVLFNIGGGIRFTVYVERRCYKLGELYSLAMQQGKSFIPQKLYAYLNQSIKEGKPALRLLKVSSGRVQCAFSDPGETVLDIPDLYVIDVLTELGAGFSRVDVLFCDRRSGESYFGFPTNIAVSNTYEETGADIAKRLAEKILPTPETDDIARWIVAVKGRSGVCRTVGKRDTLKKLVEEVKGDIECIIVDRPQLISIDGIVERQKCPEQSITIRDTSAQDLTALNSRQTSTRDLASMDK